MDDPVWDHSTFSKNRDRLLEGEIAGKFLSAVLAQPKIKRLLSSDCFSVDGTLIEAWASITSFRRKDGGDDDGPSRSRNGGRNFQGEKRSNETHQSMTELPVIEVGRALSELMQEAMGRCVVVRTFRPRGRQEEF